jgi:hypothetical protein
MATLPSSLNDQVEAIQTREDFVGFVRDLVRDLRANPGEWQNQTLDAFLEAVAAWVEDCDGYYRNWGKTSPQEPNWKILGEVLLAAKVYE